MESANFKLNWWHIVMYCTVILAIEEQKNCVETCQFLMYENISLGKWTRQECFDGNCWELEKFEPPPPFQTQEAYRFLKNLL
jgi:hypothetical protein